MGFNLNWFLGALAIEFWLAPYVLMFWPEISAAWRDRRRERMLNRLVLDYERRQARRPDLGPADQPARLAW